MDDKLIAGLLERLDALGAKLGVGADAMWAILVKQALISSVVDCLLILALMVAGTFVYRGARKAHRVIDDDEGAVFVFVALCVAGFFMSVFSIGLLMQMPSIVAGFVNPEYVALQKILSGER